MSPNQLVLVHPSALQGLEAVNLKFAHQIYVILSGFGETIVAAIKCRVFLPMPVKIFVAM
jgi:hypothetical protein